MVGALVNARIEIFAMGYLKHLLELNKLVLCGAGAAGQEESIRHFQVTERRFYE